VNCLSRRLDELESLNVEIDPNDRTLETNQPSHKKLQRGD
jgi:hypothetical protein